VIGGGDTGSDCVGTSQPPRRRQSVTQFEVMPQPPAVENRPMTWPYWPLKLRTSSSHEEGCERDWSVSTKEFRGENGHVKALVCVRVEWKKDDATGQMKMVEVAGSEFEIPADLVLFAMGFVSPVASVLESFGVAKDPAATSRPRPRAPAATRRAFRRSSPPATCGAASRSSSGRSAKAASARAPSTSS
jgi:glutamate synthase (NADPH/NADH) small chain